jgi:hypothetical protein
MTVVVDADADWRALSSVITRLDRVIHAIRSGTGATDVARGRQGVDGPVKPGHDGGGGARVIDICAACVQ